MIVVDGLAPVGLSLVIDTWKNEKIDGDKVQRVHKLHTIKDNTKVF